MSFSSNYSNLPDLKNHTLCAINLNASETSEGDSGGPIVITESGFLIGVVGWSMPGISCRYGRGCVDGYTWLGHKDVQKFLDEHIAAGFGSTT